MQWTGLHMDCLRQSLPIHYTHTSDLLLLDGTRFPLGYVRFVQRIDELEGGKHRFNKMLFEFEDM